MERVKGSVKDFGYEKANTVINEQILSKGYVSKVGNAIVGDDAKSQYSCSECRKPVWVLKGLPWRGACENCLSKKDLIGKKLAVMEGVGNVITPESFRNYYNCPTCDKEIYVVNYTPYKGECQVCLSKRSYTGKGLKAMEGVGNKITGESVRSYYNCPECQKKVYVLKGAPYRGACTSCLSNKNVFEQGVSGVAGVFKGIGGWFS